MQEVQYSKDPEPAWFRRKRYIHFDEPIRCPENVRSLVESSERVAIHAFLPLLMFRMSSRKYKKKKSQDGIVSGEYVPKCREIKYASHKDSQILRHYANLLSSEYEKILTEEGLSESVLAYRSFDPPKCNIHFANEAFEWVFEKGDCVVLTFDIKDFFEELDHLRLKEKWKEILGVKSLPKDHYNIYKAVTRYSWVDRDQVFQEFEVKRSYSLGPPAPICTPREFRDRVRNRKDGSLICVNERGKGIPQGLPISAFLSNMYMLSVDRRMVELVANRGGLYRRYSDDILLACNACDLEILVEALKDELEKLGLKLHGGLGKSSKSCFTGSTELQCDVPLQYLGFSFDGKHVRIRPQTLSRFYRRMNKAVRREKSLARHNSYVQGSHVIRRKRLYLYYSHLGNRDAKARKRRSKRARKNFINGYGRVSGRVISNNAIEKQLKMHWSKLHRLIAKGEYELEFEKKG